MTSSTALGGPGFTSAATAATYAVASCAIVFRVVRGELCVGLPIEGGVRSVPFALPDPAARDEGLESAARQAAARAVAAREIVRIGHAGVRTLAGDLGASDPGSVPGPRASPRLALVSWAIARPLAPAAGAGESVEAEEHFMPLSALPELDRDVRTLLACGFEAFLDVTLADALTRRLLPRNVLFRKTDGFGGRSPFEQALGAAERVREPEVPVFVGLLPDPFPLSQLRELYERLLGAPLDRGNFRRQFHEVIEAGPIKALPIFERGVPHRAGQLFTFDRAAWLRFAAR